MKFFLVYLMQVKKNVAADFFVECFYLILEALPNRFIYKTLVKETENVYALLYFV